MKHASLVAFLRGELSPEDFDSEIAEEVGDCISNWKSGGVGHIIVTDGPMTEVTREQAVLLLRAVLEARLSFEAANYTADALIMSDDFEFQDDAVNEAIYFLEDDSRAPTEVQLQNALARLSS
jgi:hypothetical protein